MKEGAREPKLPRALTYILLLLLLRSSCFSSPDAYYYLSSVFPTLRGQLIIVFCHTLQGCLPYRYLPDTSHLSLIFVFICCYSCLRAYDFYLLRIIHIAHGVPTFIIILIH